MSRPSSACGRRPGCGLAKSVACGGEISISTPGAAHVQRSRTRRRVGPTKTGRIRLTSFLHPVCEDSADWRPGATPESRALLTRLRTLGVTSLAPDGYLFGRPLDEQWLHGVWRQVLTKASVRYREPEQLRHTFASTLLSR